MVQQEICDRIRDNKSPELNGIQSKALTLAVNISPTWLISTFEPCMMEGVVFCQVERAEFDSAHRASETIWRTLFISLYLSFRHSGKDVGEEDIQKRVVYWSGTFCFSEPVLAMGMAMNPVSEALAVDKCYAVVTPGVRNAFNSINWNWIKGILGIPGYFVRIIDSYLSEILS